MGVRMTEDERASFVGTNLGVDIVPLTSRHFAHKDMQHTPLQEPGTKFVNFVEVM
ncbi:uncharacterized protein PHALS_03041 [Plasmopara halstedii]|uniref:Uncharacterized protein n=1 Tax=Plasmopara halstedii TaxID=4781 RepID=A0A0P1A756_PLAHL|nr:uncharacterized protein PHALS_03041 [Plasmopara halstedii]CEG36493.1 hypothetical protein PHALS_03041 [Plasmopara halstedii]|eukprot:XP_024572862.1 hypothetical protein PHALS_03041 [Plasmopara halstedii]